MNRKILIFPAAFFLAVLLSVIVSAQEEAIGGLGDIVGAGTLFLFGGIWLLVMIAFYVFSALALMTIAKKTKTPNGWLAWIPVANVYLVTQIAQVQWWYMLLVIFLPIIPILGYLAAMVIGIWMMWKVCERRKKPGWWSILMIIPVVNLIIIGMLAWSK